MAGFDALSAALANMQALQLMAGFAGAAACALAIDTSFDSRLRRAAIATAGLAAGAFVLLASSWAAGLALVVLGSLGMALFIAALRSLARLLGIDAGSGSPERPPVASPTLRIARRTLPQRPPPAIRAI